MPRRKPIKQRFELGTPDPAAILALALSLYTACNDRDLNGGANLSEAYNGGDQFMREVMRVANEFEAWACAHVDFDQLNDVWPYLLQEKFGSACVAIVSATALAEFDTADCLRIALRIRIPVRADGKLPVPITLESPNPVSGSAFHAFRIQTLRDSIDDEIPTVFSSDDEPFDEEFGAPYFGLYGIGRDGRLEHIADRRTYSEALTLAIALAPGVLFPVAPGAATFRDIAS